MAEYLSPGVFVEEVSSGNKPIEGVGTSTGAFVGRALKGPVDQAVLITNPSQFLDTFGSFHQDYYLAYAVRHFFTEGGTRCYVVRAFSTTTTAVDSDVARVILTAGGTNVLRVLASSPGAWGNEIEVEVIEPAFDPDDTTNADQKFGLSVRYQGDVVETFNQLSMKELPPPDCPISFTLKPRSTGSQNSSASMT